MTSPRRITVILDTEDSEIESADDVDELVERSICANRSELVRRLLHGEPLNDLLRDVEE